MANRAKQTVRAMASDGIGTVLHTALTHPAALTPTSAATIEALLVLDSHDQGTCETALAAMAALLYARPDLVGERLLDRLVELPKRGPLPGSIGKAVVTAFESLASGPLAGQAWRRLRGLLRDDGLAAANRDMLLPLVNDYVQWRPELVDLEETLELAECPALAGHRAFLLDYAVERFVYTRPRAFTVEMLRRIASLFDTTPRYP